MAHQKEVNEATGRSDIENVRCKPIGDYVDKKGAQLLDFINILSNQMLEQIRIDIFQQWEKYELHGRVQCHTILP